MKRITSFIIVAFILTSSCYQEKEISPSKMFEDELAILTELNQTGFNFAIVNFDQNLTLNGYFDIGLNQNQMVNDILKALNNQFFVANESVINEISNEFGEIRLSNHFMDAQSTDIVYRSLVDIYSDDQIRLLRPFVDKLLNTEDIEDAKTNAISFQQQIIKSFLTDDEKIQLLTMSSGVLGFVEFVDNGGIEKIRDALGIHLNEHGFPNSRSRGCSVSMRNVWLGAVIGGGAGALGGAKVGCAGGMVGGPIGAAGGCVGGAVMGGASGFISGALMATASELLGSCFR